MELMLGMQVFLRQWVKVKSDWSDNASLLQEFGYEP
jgi:GTPase Era involved in 16S rRNA processing